MLRSHIVPALLLFLLAAGLPGQSLAAEDSLGIAKAVAGVLHGQRQESDGPHPSAVAAALADLALLPQIPQPAPAPPVFGSATDNALADLAQSAGNRPSPERINPDQAYLDQVVKAIADNWDGQGYIGRSLSARIRLNLNAQGLILSSTVLEASGDSAFDSGALYAVLRTTMLPQPPDVTHQELFIYFSPLGLNAGI